MLSGREEWSLVPVFPLESQSLGASGLLMSDLLLPGTVLRESSLRCPWSCILETQHSHHLETDHFFLLLGLLLSVSLVPPSKLGLQPIFIHVMPPQYSALGSWGLRLEFQLEGPFAPSQGIGLGCEQNGEGVGGKAEKYLKDQLCAVLGSRCVCFIL